MSHYFRSDEGGERSVCLAFGFLSLLVAMLVLVVREDYLEFGLESGMVWVLLIHNQTGLYFAISLNSHILTFQVSLVFSTTLKLLPNSKDLSGRKLLIYFLMSLWYTQKQCVLYLKLLNFFFSIPFTKLGVKLGLAFICAFFGALLAFPGLRLAQTHLDAVQMNEKRPVMQ